MTAISGNTYPVKDQIKALGGKWNPDQKVWMVPDAKVDEARALVGGASATSSPKSYHPHTCIACGATSRDVKILRSGECRDCYQERRMGY